MESLELEQLVKKVLLEKLAGQNEETPKKPSQGAKSGILTQWMRQFKQQ